MKKNTKIVIISLVFLLGVFLGADSEIAQGIGMVIEGGDCNTTDDCLSGLECVSCATYGAKCLGKMCWKTSAATSTQTNLCAVGNTCGNSNEACYKVSGGCACSTKSSVKVACDMSASTSAKVDTSLTDSVLDSSSGTTNAANNTSSNIVFTNPLKYKTVNEFATNVLGTLRSIIVVLSIIFIVLGGIFYITSAGNETRMKAAKGAITASIIGLAVGIAAPSFLKEIYSIMGGNSSDIDNTAISGSLTLTQISLNFLDFLLAIVGVLALIMLIVGGIMYLTSAGDDDRIKTAKKIVTYSIIGIAISLASMVIVKQIANLLT